MDRIPERRAGALLTFIVLLLITPTLHWNCSINIIEEYQQLSIIPDSKPEYTLAEADGIILEDHFRSSPLGFNTSLWSLTTHSNPSITWENEEWLGFEVKSISYAILKSNIQSGINSVAEFNLTFTQGLCYFGVGWADKIISEQKEWITNMRACQNGVFLDYWDNELCLVTYCNGERIAGVAKNVTLNQEHLFRIEWYSTQVCLIIDDIEEVIISRKIPQNPLNFIITTSSHYDTFKKDLLRLNFVRLSSHMPDDTAKLQIDLLWPKNGTEITKYDSIDLDVRGSNGILCFSWNDESNETVEAPWDILVPSTPGVSVLHAYAENSTGNWISQVLCFVIVERESLFVCPMMKEIPLIDGIISTNEKQQCRILSCQSMTENRDYEDVTVYMAFAEGLMYVGITSKLEDKWNSRISLLIDGSGDMQWDSDIGTFPEDIRIAVGTPGAFGAFTGIYSPGGSEISNALFTGLTMASSSVGHISSAEFTLNPECVDGNATMGIGIGLVISRGGYNSFFPAHLSYGSFSNLFLIRNSGIANPNPINEFLIISGASVFLLVTMFGLASILMKQRVVSIDRYLEDENLERIKTLLYSYERISLERLSRITGLEKNKVSKLVHKLVERGLADISIIKVDQEFIRSLPDMDKREKVEMY